MYIATQDITSYKHGKIKKGQQAPFNESWLDAGLIKEGKEKKPQPRKQVETKPHKS